MIQLGSLRTINWKKIILIIIPIFILVVISFYIVYKNTATINLIQGVITTQYPTSDICKITPATNKDETSLLGSIPPSVQNGNAKVLGYYYTNKNIEMNFGVAYPGSTEQIQAISN